MAAPFLIVSILCMLTIPTVSFGVTTINKNDPYPVFTSADPVDYLTQDRKNHMLMQDASPCIRFRFSASPFFQKATIGRNFENIDTELGNLSGRWNMTALFYPAENTDETVNNDVPNGLLTQLDLNNINPVCLSTITTPTATDVQKQFGFFSVPIIYEKYGIRFNFDWLFTENIGMNIQTGFVDIKQTATFIDLTCRSGGFDCPPAALQTDCNPDECIDMIPRGCKQVVIDKIMKERVEISRLLNLSTANFEKRGIEDIYTSLYWRHIYPVNQHLQDWPLFYCTPYFSLNASFPTASKVSPRCLFALPAGNNGHFGAGFTAGVTIDFVETLEIGIEAGMTEWSPRTYRNFPVPTSPYQAGMFPYQAVTRIRPGTNWNFAATLNAYHFLERLSMYVQYAIVNHGADHISLKKIQKPNPELVPDPSSGIPEIFCEKIRKYSRFEVHVLNIGFNYDIAPTVAIGFFWQAPVRRLNAYRSSTVMGSLMVTY